MPATLYRIPTKEKYRRNRGEVQEKYRKPLGNKNKESTGEMQGIDASCISLVFFLYFLYFVCISQPGLVAERILREKMWREGRGKAWR